MDSGFTTTLTITSKDPLYIRTDNIYFIINKLMAELKIKGTDPNDESSRAQDIIDLLEDIKHYEEAIIISKAINIIDKGLHKMKNADRPFVIEIEELTKLRMELMKHSVVRADMSLTTRKICEEVTKEIRNQRLRLEINFRRKPHRD